MKQEGKQGQISIFVILAIIIIVAGLLIFFIKPDLIGINSSQENVDSYITQCMEDAAKEIIPNISKQGGFASPENYILYGGEKIGYTCYNVNFYQTCVMQTPQITGFIASQIEDYVSPRLEACYNQIKNNMEKKGYSVVMGNISFDVNLFPGKVELNAQRELSITKNDEHYSYDEFEIQIVEPLYDFSQIALDISNQEAKFCNFEYLGYMLLYPRWSIEKDDVNGLAKVYTIKEKNTGKYFRLAIRSCALPAGM